MKTRSLFPAALTLTGLTLINFNSQISTASAQGSLTPPGPPAPAMLTLNQIEPRTPLDAVHTPGNSSTEFLINQPGSYYFTTNLVGVAGESGIYIITNNVTLDLKGFSLTGPSTAYSGIYISSVATNVVIRNGIISGFNPLYLGIYSYGNNVLFENLSIYGAGTGIQCSGDGGVVKNCLLSHNAGDGLYVGGPNYLIVGNQLVENNTMNTSTGAAISITTANNRIDDNFVTGNGPAGYGILVGNSASITNNIVIRNTVFGNGAKDYSFSTSQIVGPLITNTVSGVITNSNPWANFAF